MLFTKSLERKPSNHDIGVSVHVYTCKRQMYSIANINFATASHYQGASK